MIIENKDGLTMVYAEDENKLTNSQRTFFSDFIYLGKFDSVDNYEEVPRAIWKQFVKDNNPTLNGAIEDIQELQEKTTKLQEDAVSLNTNIESLQESTAKLQENDALVEETLIVMQETQVFSNDTSEMIMMAVAESDEKHEDMTDLLLLGMDDMFVTLEPLLIMYEEMQPMALTLDDEPASRKSSKLMVRVYSEIVKRELKTIDEIPARFRDAVKTELGEI